MFYSPDFVSSYTVNLSQDAQVAVTDSVYRPRGMPKGINPQELLGLHSVLALIRVVAGTSHSNKFGHTENYLRGFLNKICSCRK